MLYPDAADVADSVQMQYNLQSEPTFVQDQNGTVHQYLRDLLGRQTSDIAVTLGAGVYGTGMDDFYAMLRIDTAYEIRGMVNLLTSYADIGAATIVNQVALTFGDFEQATQESQDPARFRRPNLLCRLWLQRRGASNSIALLRVNYPDTSQLLYNRTATDDIALDRVTSLQFNGESAAVASYGYFGLASVASVTYGASSSVVSLTLASGASYPGFDQFGRVIDVSWVNSSSALVAGLAYGYNLASSRTYRQDVKASSNFDELYGYDGLQRGCWHLTAAHLRRTAATC